MTFRRATPIRVGALDGLSGIVSVARRGNTTRPDKKIFEPALLQPAQFRNAASLLARAFIDDPLHKHLLPLRPERAVILEELFFGLLNAAQPASRVLTTPGDVQGVAIWVPPSNGGEFSKMLSRFRSKQLRAIFGESRALRLKPILEFLDTLGRPLTLEPHWYLCLLGVSPESQRGGIGRELVRHVLAQARSTGTPCYLETQKPSNLPFYLRLGFTIYREAVEPMTNLKFWSLRA